MFEDTPYNHADELNRLTLEELQELYTDIIEAEDA
jgi:hypothetical protein